MAKVALLIGVSEYELGLNPLPGAIRDAQAMQRVLQHPDMGGFDQVQVLENPQRQTMEEAIEHLFAYREKDDLVLLYFSGHGVKDNQGRLYFATRTTRKRTNGELVKATAVPANFVHDVMSNSRSKRQVVLLDCCFGGAFANGLLAKDDGSVDIKNELGAEGRAVLTASTSTQFAFEQQGSDLSVYTRFIIEGIETGVADTNNDGVVSVDELHEYACKKVQEAAPAMKPEIYAIREGFKIHLAKAPVDDAKVRYRKEVEQCAERGEITIVGRRILDRRRTGLELSAVEATAIEDEVLKPYREYQQNLQEYEQVLIEVIQQENPLSDYYEDLKRLQILFNLRDEDIASIEARVVRPEPPISLVDKVVVGEVDYTKLQELLKAGKWKEADQETSEVMHLAISKSQIRVKDLNNFPCQPLIQLDQLWQECSTGKFGFGVQAQLWQELNADEAEFDARVGWRVDPTKRQRNYNNLTFSLDAPPGHLPAFFKSWGGGGWTWKGYILSRFNICKAQGSQKDNLETV